jgi:hypothetical protein
MMGNISQFIQGGTNNNGTLAPIVMLILMTFVSSNAFSVMSIIARTRMIVIPECRVMNTTVMPVMRVIPGLFRKTRNSNEAG